MDTNQLYSCRDAAAVTGKSLAAVRAYVRRHRLGVKVGRDYVLTAADLATLRAAPAPGWPPDAATRRTQPRTETQQNP